MVASWSRRQACLALSSAESELYALGSGAVEALGFATMLGEWSEHVVPMLYSDSSSALHVVKKRGPGRMKHIELRCLALQQRREEKRLLFGKVGTEENVSDMLTKPMTKERLIKLASMVGLRGVPTIDPWQPDGEQLEPPKVRRPSLSEPRLDAALREQGAAAPGRACRETKQTRMMS